MKKISTVIFDFDGVIADTLPYTFKKLHQLAKILKTDNQKEKQILKEIRLKDWKDLLKTGMNLNWFKIPFVLMMVHRMQIELGREIKNIKVFPGMKKLFLDLNKKNYHIAIVSSNIKKNIEDFLKLNDIGPIKYIEARTNSLLAGKADLINKYISVIGANKENVIYVGDEVRDVNACKKVGIKCISVSWGLHTKDTLIEAGADFLVNRPSEILKIITKN